MTPFDWFGKLKDAVAALVPFDRDGLHVCVGAAILVLCLAAPGLRRRRSVCAAALGLALAAGALSELMDFANHLVGGMGLIWGEYASDVLWTATPPALALAVLALMRRTCAI